MTKRLGFVSTLSFSVLALLLGACQPGQDAPQPEADSNVVPASLRVSAKIDSVITLTEPIDISVLSAIGKGPAGALIRSVGFDPTGSNSSFATFTYDGQGRPASTLSVSDNTWTSAEIVRYQGEYLAEHYGVEFINSSRSAARVLYFRTYRYNANKQVEQTLFYSRYGSAVAFSLVASSTYEYDANGELRLMRSTSTLDKSSNLWYWKNGDCIRMESYQPPTANNPHLTVMQIIYSYDQQINPLGALPFFYGSMLPPSKHYQTHVASYQLNSNGSFEKIYENEQATECQLDAQGHVVSTRNRELPNEFWSSWGLAAFTYAP